ncbi:bifunctional GNAT family N-acetyltransferase/carbon-nitrogen hydrolase family protein [Marivirga atlantica]|jgi:predicted amidohydrolase/GNAT superfamily N-acetyltransferase|uniref:GNAT family N-acetyltransferase n=1 Tax=Marivirga atlantica TaxID=1548457 RepID=A0A937DIC4_9BACT|nr:bifunctional GNAT family N-acetyltransferase/carbon-nitrogen hydrolase family protein [Marivirga atlantica]MBL0766848.1 GNAT family N-acetyltransferase [Marivirga atlantica]
MQDNLIITLENLKISNYRSLISSMKKAYEGWDDLWEEKHIETLINKFPEGQLCVLVNGQVAGCALSIIVDYEKFGDKHTYPEITGNETFETHDDEGDVLYGIDVFVHPDYRGMRVGRRMYDARKDLAEQLNLKSILAGGRLPSYREHADKLSPKQYIQKVKNKELYDATLSFQLSNDFHVKKVIKGYLPGDKESMDYAALIEWNNIFYEPSDKLVDLPKTVIRLGLVQWQMRPTPSLRAMQEQIEFFVDVVSGYKCDFILFPELFNAPLMAEFNHMDEPSAIRELAKYTEPLREIFQEYAINYNVNIITGSMPVMFRGKLYNKGFLCRRDGTYETYEKIHMTPAEVSAWGMSGGKKIETFDTDCGKIGVNICYDVEFPELSRLMADEDMKILFVPFLTDTQNGYMRVRHCAQARAIENECYVAIAGSVGNLPKVNNMDIQFAQSAVFTPSDFAFPTNAVKAEATPNTEMTLIADVDVDLLKELHTYGSVRNLNDRRKDLYSLKKKSQ